MSENLATLWKRWKDYNIDLWRESTTLTDENSPLMGVKAFMSEILQREANPFDKKDIKEFNKRLGNSSMSIKGTSLKSTTSFSNLNKQDYQIQFLMPKDKKKNFRLKIYNVSDSESLKRAITIEKEFLNVDIKEIKAFINDSKNGLEKEYQKMFPKTKIEGFRVVYVSLNKNIINIFMRNSDKKEKYKSFSLQKSEDLIQKLWNESYKVYIDNNFQTVLNSIEPKLRADLEKEIQNEKGLEEKIKNIDKELENRINKKTLAYLTHKWVEINSKSIEKILEQVDFYRDKDLGEKRRKSFLDFFKKQIRNKNLSYYSSIGEYIQAFGGDFGEIDTLVRPHTFLKERQERELTGEVKIELLGKELTDNSKQAPADGKITFMHKNKQYTCTFQSKLFKSQTYQNGLYKGKGFTLGFNVDNNTKKSNLYAYNKEILEEYGYEVIGRKIQKKHVKDLEESQNYIGSLPGLLRIRTFVLEADTELNRSDFYYFSGYYIPSCYLLRKIKSEYSKMEKTDKLPLKVEVKNNLVVGTLLPWNIYTFLSEIIN